MSTEDAVLQGTLALVVLKTLNVMEPQHGYGIVRCIEKTSNNLLSIDHGTLYPLLLKLEQEGVIKSEWCVSENHRRAKVYRITSAGRKQLDMADASVPGWIRIGTVHGYLFGAAFLLHCQRVPLPGAAPYVPLGAVLSRTW